MDGWALARALRARGLDAPILMMSANLGEAAAPGADADHDAVLPKPFDLARLLDLLGSLLALDWIEGKPAAASTPPVGAPASGVSPSDLAELRRLGAIGYVRGIEAKLAALADDPARTGLVSALRERIGCFDLDGYAALIDAAAHEDAALVDAAVGEDAAPARAGAAP